MTTSAHDFKPVEIDELDQKLNETAARKRIPTMKSTEIVDPETNGSTDVPMAASRPLTAPRKPLSIEVPDYLATELKIKAARQSVTVRHLVLTALVAAGYDIEAVDMDEDGRRLR